MHSKSATIKNKNISYTDSGSKQTIVLLHGYLETKEVWNEFADTLSQNFRVICIDIPGHGQSDKIAETQSMELLADYINELLLELEVDKFTIVGHSMGGYVSLAFANIYKEKLDGLVLFHSSVYADNDEKKKNRLREIEFIKQGKKDLILNVNLPKMFADENVEKYSSVISDIQSRASKTDNDGICALLRGMMDRKDQQEFIKKIAKPMLFIFGEKDNYIPVEAGKNMLALNNEIQGLWLKDSGHMGFVEDFEVSVNAITNFVNSVEK